ncbi:MAG: histidinol phosphate phosphatase [Gemmatimonadales bacterium]|nr:MAG: histidinol phosphate phosphatase [Gemmatimonadales bacterium]
MLPPPDELRAVALDLAREAGALTLETFGDLLEADDKEDGSPVTRTDCAAEALLRRRILARYPGHGVLGEEEGETPGSEPVRWILDPIDGTRSFMRGVPLYTVLLGVEVHGEPVVGVIHAPALGESVAAARGLGAQWHRPGERAPVPARVNGQSALGESAVLTSDPTMSRESPWGAGWVALTRAADMTRSWGDAYGHLLVATGRAEVMVDPYLSPWDAGPLLTVLSEAGGRFTDLEGRPGIHGGSGLSTNGLLHDEVLALLQSGRSGAPS